MGRWGRFLFLALVLEEKAYFRRRALEEFSLERAFRLRGGRETRIDGCETAEIGSILVKLFLSLSSIHPPLFDINISRQRAP